MAVEMAYAHPLEEENRQLRERNAWLEQQHERDQRVIREQQAIIKGVLEAAGNENLTPADRIIGIKVAIAQEYCFGKRGTDEVPMSLGWIAEESGVSRQRVTAFRQKLIGTDKHARLADLEIFATREEKKPRQDGTWETRVHFERKQSAPETLQLLAKVSVGRTKAGGKRERRITIPERCEVCGGDHFTLVCGGCGAKTAIDPLEPEEVEAAPSENGSTPSVHHNGAQGLSTSPINHSPREKGAPFWRTRDDLPHELEVYHRVNEARTNEGAALAYASIGWKVFPCHTPDIDGNCSCGKECGSDCGKHPRWAPGVLEHGCNDATSDPETIRALWARWPDANPALATDGRLVIDIDEEGLEASEDLEREDVLPETLTARTGSGGKHLVCALPEGVTLGNGTGSLPSGIHVRSTGGYIIAAPSLHKSGQLYQWVDIRPIAQAPEALLRILTPPEPPPRPRSADLEKDGPYYTTGPVIPDGTRNEELARIAGGMVARGARGAQLEQLLLEVNQNRCQPPKPDSEVCKIARSVEATHRRRNGGGGLPPSPVPQFPRACMYPGHQSVRLGMDGQPICNTCHPAPGPCDD